MKYLGSDRSPRAAEGLLDEIRSFTVGPATILEAVGGQALNLLRLGTDRRLPPELDLIHGPGCPICALPLEVIDRAIMAAETPGVVLCAPGDMLRVPGTSSTLENARRRGCDVRPVYSALDAVAIARKNPEHLVVFLAVGFETTAPAAAAAVLEADRLQLDRFAILDAHLRYLEGLSAALRASARQAQVLLAAGSEATVIGLRAFEGLALRHGLPVIVTGPEPVDLLEAIRSGLRQRARGEAAVENQYTRAVRPDGSPQAVAMIEAVFEPVDVAWRGFGYLSSAGLALRDRFKRFDAVMRLGLGGRVAAPGPLAVVQRCDDVINGLARPSACPAFAVNCTLERPLGAPMVSAEGICSAYHRNRRPTTLERSGALPILSAEVQGQATG